MARADESNAAHVDYVSLLLADAAEQRGAGQQDEWLESRYMVGLRFKEGPRDRFGGQSIVHKLSAVEDWHFQSEVVGGLAFNGNRSRLSLANAKVKTLYGCQFTGSWERIELSGKRLINCQFNELGVSELNLVRAFLEGTEMNKLGVGTAYVAGAQFVHCTLRGASIAEVIGGGRGTTLKSTFDDTDLSDCKFVKGRLPGTVFQRCDLSRSDFGEVLLDKVHFPYSNLTSCSLATAGMTSRTSFVDVAAVDNCLIARNGLDSLKGWGGLTLKQRQRLRIRDPLAEIRSQFGGFLGTFHVLALCIFLSPYIVFLARQYWTSELLTCTAECETILVSLWRFIYTGGRAEGDVSWVLAVFIVFLCYNAARASLLWKTKQLELALVVTGVPPRFSLDGVWGKVLALAKVGVWVNLGAVVLHVIHFLDRLVPLTR